MVNALFGRVFFRCSDLRRYDGYFTCVNLTRPLLDNPNFRSSIAGFYINVSGDFNSVRLSYFTNDKTETERAIREFLDETPDVSVFKREAPHMRMISESYGGDESRFRDFLHTYAQIGLDLLSYDILYSRRLVAEYRLTYSSQRISCRPLFEPAFRKHSSFFNQLGSSAVEQLWKDLDYWHSVPRAPGLEADWAHMLVNMLLPGDWNPIPRSPVTREEKERLLRMFNLDMPDDWSPDD